MKRLFTHSQYGQIQVKAISKSGRYMELNVPSVSVVCPHCLGRSGGACGVCDGLNVIQCVAPEFLTQYPRIDRAMRRYDRQEQEAAWERHGESMLGC